MLLDFGECGWCLSGGRQFIVTRQDIKRCAHRVFVSLVIGDGCLSVGRFDHRCLRAGAVLLVSRVDEDSLFSDEWDTGLAALHTLRVAGSGTWKCYQEIVVIESRDRWFDQEIGLSGDVLFVDVRCVRSVYRCLRVPFVVCLSSL